ncbi:hypothetical protein FB45DRAFT_705224, partial [Roridomyces roridus]
PVLSLPKEITTDIFLRCLPDTVGTHPNDRRFPLLPLYVCRAWRDVALSTPTLWVSL